MNTTPENAEEPKPKNWKQIIKHEMVEYYSIFLFLAFFLLSFAWYRHLVLAEFHIKYFGYWGPIFQAAVLAKLIMIGDALRMGRQFRSRSLAVTTIYNTIVFASFVGLFTVLEHLVGALVHGKKMATALDDIASKGWDQLLASSLLVFVAFFPFFAFRELERVLGVGKLRSLFFHRPATPEAKAAEHPEP